MGDKSAIEWTDATWNPVTGCNEVSPGCKNCYAKRIFKRPYPDREFHDVQCHPERLDQPLRWKKPRRIFVNSMSDLFHEAIPDEFIDQVFAVMAICSVVRYRCHKRDCDHMAGGCFIDRGPPDPEAIHTFQILTKRQERMLAYLSEKDRREKILDAANLVGWDNWDEELIFDSLWPLPNVHLGVSCEDQVTADERIPLLLQTPAAVRFISAEPLIGPIDVQPWITAICCTNHDHVRGLCGFDGVDWVIVGGESGPKARPMHPQWARDLRDQCVAAGVAFFFKQWGEFESIGMHTPRAGDSIVWSDGTSHSIKGGEMPSDPRTAVMRRVGKKKAGAMLDGREWREYPGVGR